MRFNDAKQPAPFVELDAGGYLLDMLMEAGPIKPGVMGGFGALDWVDIAAYTSLTVDHIEPWEASLLREMSQAFATGMSEGANSFSKAPADRKAD